MLEVGLTGGIACGKTTISNIFSNFGVPIIDADIVAREVVEPSSSGLKKITTQFGQQILSTDGTLNRKKLRQIIFSDAAAKKQLEDILHPLIRKRVAGIISALPTDTTYCIKVIPLLFETNQAESVDRVLVIDCPEDLQIQRIIARDHCSIDEAKSIIASQISREERIKRADDIITNNTTPDDLFLQVQALHRKYNQCSDIAP